MTSTLTRSDAVPEIEGTTLEELEDMIKVPGVYIVTITPDAARRLLERNSKNRNPKSRAIDQYAREMREGRWRVINQGIGFDRDGILADGQNRLLACIQAGTAFSTLLVTGLDPDAREVIDTGVKRLFSDVLRMHGYVNVMQLAGAVGLRYRYERLVEEKRPYHHWNLPVFRPTHEVLLGFFNEHQSLLAAGNSYYPLLTVFPALPASSAIAFESLAMEKDQEALQEFRTALITGANLAIGDPRLALRNFLSKSERTRKGGPTSIYFLGVMVKAWNDWRAGLNRQQLMLRENEATPGIDVKPKWEARKRRS